MSSLLNILLSFVHLLLCCSVSDGIVTLDTSADLTGWKITGCAYGDGYEDNEFAPCRVNVTEDGEMNSGYWSFCDSLSSCRLTYTMGDEIITAIRIRSFVVPNAGATSPVTKITYRNSDGANKFKNFPAEAEGWELIEFMFEEDLRAGATIEVSQTGFYNNGMDIALVDKIILSDGLGPLPTTTTTEPTTTTTEATSTTTTTTNQPTSSTTEGSTISTTTDPTTPPETTTTGTTTPYTPPPPIPDEVLLDREEYLQGWEINCEYEHDYSILSEKCNSSVSVDAVGSGYWSNCLSQNCTFSYTVTEESRGILQEDENYALIEIALRTYMNTNAPYTSPRIQIVTTNENDVINIYFLETISGWNLSPTKVHPLKPNSRIEIIQTSAQNSTEEFCMVDKISLRFGPVEVDDGDNGDSGDELSVLHISLIALAAVLLLILIVILSVYLIRRKKPSYAHMDELTEKTKTRHPKRSNSPAHDNRKLSETDNSVQQEDFRIHYDSSSPVIPRAHITGKFNTADNFSLYY